MQTRSSIWEGRSLKDPKHLRAFCRTEQGEGAHGHTVRSCKVKPKLLGPVSIHRTLEQREPGFRKKCWDIGGRVK